MKFACYALLLLVGSAVCFGQSAGGGFSFSNSPDFSSQTHFGLDTPGFPSTSASHPDFLIDSTTWAVRPALPYAYPVAPLRLGRAGANTLLGTAEGAGGRSLILVFRNQTVEAATASWIEGNMLHYATYSRMDKAIPMKRVNWKLTEETNSIARGTLASLLKK